MVAAHSGALAGDTAGWTGVLRRRRSGAGHRSGRIHRHPGTFRRRTAGPPRPERSPPCTIPAPSAHCARMSPTISASSSPTCPPARWPPSASCSTTDWTPPTRSTCGARARTPAPCSARACVRCRRTRRWPSPHWPSIWSPSTTATPPTPTRFSMSRRTPAAPLAVLASVPSAVDPVDRTTAAGQRYTRARGHAQRAGRAGPPGATGHCPSTHPRCGWTRSDGSAGGTLSPPGRWPAFELLADYGIPVVASRIARTASTRRCPPQTGIGYPVALKTQGALHKTEVGGVVLDLTDDDALRAAYGSMSAALGPRVSVDAMARPGVEVSVGFVHDDAFGPAARGRRRRRAGGTARRPGGGLRARRAKRAHGDCSPRCGSRRCWPAGAARRPSTSTRWPRSIAGFSQLAIELGDVLDAVEANPVIASPDGAVVVDALVIARDLRRSSRPCARSRGCPRCPSSPSGRRPCRRRRSRRARRRRG